MRASTIDLGLGGRHHLVLEALKEDQRTGELVGVVDGRALAVESRRFRIGPDEAVEVTRLELVGVGGQALEVGDAVVAGAGLEDIVERERAQRGVAAGAAAADGTAGRRRPRRARRGMRAGDAVVDVDDAPRALEASR